MFLKTGVWFVILLSYGKFGKTHMSKDLSHFQWKSAHAPKKELPQDFL